MLDTVKFFDKLIADTKAGNPRSICSVCSSNRLVIEAALEEGKRNGKPVLIETTANQTNQFGGYTGMLPADFMAYVLSLCEKTGFDPDMLILGGDHLGPLVWTSEPEASAMDKADKLVRCYAAAGFRKIHLDCSMRLADDDPNAALPVEVVARRAARLAKVAEAASDGKPTYIVGSEVPIPGGATDVEDGLSVTKPEDLLTQCEAFHRAFIENGVEDAWDRVVGVVVQPGVEFGDNQVFLYNHEKAAILVETAKQIPHMILEGHSTDYQSKESLSAMRQDGIGILKVGPALTFAAREAVYALETMEKEMLSGTGAKLSLFTQTLEDHMLASPANWKRHYHGDERTLSLMRKYSLSDRSRYYMDIPAVKESLDLLIRNFDSLDVPVGLIHQYLPAQADSIIAGKLGKTAEDLIKENVCYVLRTYQ